MQWVSDCASPVVASSGYCQNVMQIAATDIASVYGMNLKFPELEFLGAWSYPYTVALMIGSALVPMWYFRKRGWLK
jgi:magnesium transporter